MFETPQDLEWTIINDKSSEEDQEEQIKKSSIVLVCENGPKSMFQENIKKGTIAVCKKSCQCLFSEQNVDLLHCFPMYFALLFVIEN